MKIRPRLAALLATTLLALPTLALTPSAAPGFELASMAGQSVNLAAYRGR